MKNDSFPQALTVLSSMATRYVLQDLADAHEQQSGTPVSLVSVGGVDAARRVQEGERWDVVVLASDALQRLCQAGYLEDRSRTDVARSQVAAAVRMGEPSHDIGSELAVRETILRARSVGFSTGPSGNHVIGLLRRWGIHDVVQPRLVEAPPGVPVAGLIAEGKVEVGFQQLSELHHHPGIMVIGTLPSAIQADSVFSAAISLTTDKAEAARAFLERLTSPDSAEVKRKHGMEQV